jgi:hypothetical protein
MGNVDRSYFYLNKFLILFFYFFFVFDIKSEFSYIICSYLRRLHIQNSFKCTGTLQIFINLLPNSIGIFYLKLQSIYRTVYMLTDSAGFTYRLNRLKPRASKFREPLAKMYNIFNTVIGLSDLCCHNVMYFLNNPSVILAVIA